MNKLVQIACLLTLISVSLQQNEEYHEELIVKPLPSGHVNTYFQFTTRWNLTIGEDLFNTHLIPRSIAEILEEFDVKEFHISLTQGLWRHELWGYPVLDASPGAEIWAWFSNSDKNLTVNDVDLQWKNLCGKLSGILCASLNFVDSTNSVEPKFSFGPKFGISPRTAKIPKYIRYSTLPREIVCTENLTPWKKLLPCSSKNGFTSLLNSGHIYNTNFHSLGVSVRTFCESSSSSKIEEGCVIEVTQTANLVYGLKLLLGSIGPDVTYFSLRRMFGQGLMGACPLAKSSKIYVDITEETFEISPLPNHTFISKRGGITSKFAEFDIKNDKMIKISADRPFNIMWKRKNHNVQIYPPPPLYAHRYILGQGQERGKIVTKITNNYWTPMIVIIQENIPWFVPCYLHTLSLRIDENNLIKPKFVYFIPGKQREKPYHLEVGFVIPALKAIEISISFDYKFLKWLEYPPDANHGHYLGSAVISTILPTGRNYTSVPIEGFLYAHSFNASRSAYFLQLRTESLILSLPTPDFSMPYNVICLACTVVALAFGPIHSVATKKIVVEKKSTSQSLLAKLKEKVIGKKKHEDGGDENEDVEDDKDNEDCSRSDPLEKQLIDETCERTKDD